jgi:hypothetical protein
MFRRNLLAVEAVHLNHCAGVERILANSCQRARPCEDVTDRVTRGTAQSNTPLVKALMQLGWMMLSPLLTISRNSREIKTISRYATTRISPLVAVKLPPRRYPHGVGVQLSSFPHEPPQWAVVVSKVVLVVLPERENLHAGFERPSTSREV